jgi:nicotinate-nucleotide pyrophosphorylase (carboxylating)
MFTSDLIRRALDEDLGDGDRTSAAIIPADLRAVGRVLAKEELVVAGLGVAGGVFVTVDPGISLTQRAKDGEWVGSGTVVMEAAGPCRSLLAAERTALNFLQRLSGIATMTASFVARTRGTRAKILDTRKTVPLLRHLDKYAVRMGGGVNHRMGLYDGILIKDNHLALMRGTIRGALEAARAHHPGLPVIVEVTTPDLAVEAVGAGATRLLLDNMTDEAVRETVARVGGKAELEVSGGITLERVERLARMGVDFISVGALTHSPKAADLSLEIEPA